MKQELLVIVPNNALSDGTLELANFNLTWCRKNLSVNHLIIIMVIKAVTFHADDDDDDWIEYTNYCPLFATFIAYLFGINRPQRNTINLAILR